MNGKVYLIGAGPGDPDLLTHKAWRLLQAADLVLHDDLVSPAILALVSPHARVCRVGKRCGRRQISQEEINTRMVSAARAGMTVARLKSGDPEIFSRLGEEIAALQEAAVDFEIIPGVTAACAAAAAARIPLTDRRYASELIFATGHRVYKEGSTQAERPLLSGAVTRGTTVVVYMPGSDYQSLAKWLLQSGLSPETPCLLVASASRAGEARRLTTLEHLPQVSPLAAPAVLIVGAVAALAASSRDLHLAEEAPVAAGARESS